MRVSPVHPYLGPKRGLYDPKFEHDACGIGFVARLDGAPEHGILDMALTALSNVAHRGGTNADGKSGDGAGVLTAIPRTFFAQQLALLGVDYPVDHLAVGMCFMPCNTGGIERARQIVARSLSIRGLILLGWRTVPVDSDALGVRSLESCPAIEQALIGYPPEMQGDHDTFERSLYLARKSMEAEATREGLVGFSIPSMSCRTIVYKGLLAAPLLRQFYPDLQNSLYSVTFAIYHQRYSTNTAPTWERAQPFRMLSHNGEINTIDGNIAWMAAREAAWQRDEIVETSQATPGGPALAAFAARIAPIVDTSGSDSAMLDNTLELIVHGGRDIRHGIAMLVPEAWESVPDMSNALRAFYEYHSGLTEPWDGPAALAFSDGQVVGLALDRNGLRPARYLLTDDGLVLCGSEAGSVAIDPARVIRKGKLGPGMMLAVDLRTGEFLENDAIKHRLAAAHPYEDWLADGLRLPDPRPSHYAPYSSTHAPETLQKLQQAFGYTSEELTAVLRPMLEDGVEPVGSMGDDTSPAFLSNHARSLYAYIKQRFAEVTNPPMDPLREKLVMSLVAYLGTQDNLLSEQPVGSSLLRLASPILSDASLASISALDSPAFPISTLSSVFNPADGSGAMLAALKQLCAEAEAAVEGGSCLLVISDRATSDTNAPIPALLVLGAIHSHLIDTGLRRKVGLIVESGEPREVHHMACLVGMGAEAVNPYLALETVRHIAHEREELARRKAASPNGSRQPDDTSPLTPEHAERNYVRALEKALLKIMSKMGISTFSGYCGAQVFEALGLSDEVIDFCFRRLTSRLGGVGFAKLEADVLRRHTAAFDPDAAASMLPNPGFYKYKKEGEHHTYSPAVVHALQKAVRDDADYETYRAYSDLVHSRPPTEFRDLLAWTPGDAIPLDEVEPIEAIVQRFSTAAMSHGSTSSEAHETLAIAMNRLGGLSNSGEGGEDPDRFGGERNSPIKQVASARFGVTPAYLMSASELQIKMAQGSKPGEGGQLPGHKVSEEIARIRHAAPGIELVSPPPHHDIYSIEDLAQLIYDLKQVKPGVDVSVKLVAEAGVGTVAVGVAKAGADIILISGHSGGTGASPLSSIKNAGVNWELGLSETQQTLVISGLRGRVRLRTDGGLKTGQDVVIAAMLGADQFSFGTAALVAQGCLMARTCHSNNCPVGIATQRPELRAKFTGTPDQVIHFFLHLAQEVREILARLGVRSLNEIIGRSDLLHQQERGYPEVDLFDLSAMLTRVDGPCEPIRHDLIPRIVVPGATLNARLLADCASAIAHFENVDLTYPVTNRDRTVGATLSGAIAQRYGDAGLPEGTITVRLEGSAGQSFGAFLTPGVRLLLSGEANDYVGKGMAGGEIAIYQPPTARYPSHRNSLIGNTVLYGATGGALFVAGMAGERFAVRNSGAIAVVEGMGAHGCEYMTGGVVLSLGAVGLNFAAGMSGGVAYVFDVEGSLRRSCNHDTVSISTLDYYDDDLVFSLLIKHLEMTHSRRADDILLGWNYTRHNFLCIHPHNKPEIHLPDLKRVAQPQKVEVAV